MSHSKPTGIDRIRSFPFGIYRFHLKPTRSKIYETDRIELESMSNSKPIGFDRIRSFPFEIYRFHLKPIGSRIGSATHRQRRDMSDRRTSAWNWVVMGVFWSLYTYLVYTDHDSWAAQHFTVKWWRITSNILCLTRRHSCHRKVQWNTLWWSGQCSCSISSFSTKPRLIQLYTLFLVTLRLVSTSSESTSGLQCPARVSLQMQLEYNSLTWDA